MQRRLGQVEHRRHDVDVLDDRVHPAAGAFTSGRLDDQRDSDRFLVGEQAVPGFAVVAEPFAVIGRQDDRRLVVELVRLEVLDEAADELVDVSNLAVVRLERVEPRWRRVRRVRLVEVQEQERPLGAGLFQPAFRNRHRVGAVARQAASGLAGGGVRHLAVEERKALGDAGRRPQRVTGHDTGGRVAAVREHLGEQAFVAFDGEPDIVAHAGLERQPAGEKRRVGRQRLRRVGVRPIEHDAVASQRIDRGRPQGGVAVDRQAIRPQRVDREEHDRSADRRGRARVAPPADRGECGPERHETDDHGVTEVGAPIYFFSCSSAVRASAASGDSGSMATTSPIRRTAVALSPVFIASRPSL